MSVAEGYIRILDDPSPTVNFEEFGDSALILTLRAYTDPLGFRLTTKSELHQAIYEGLAEADIPIAFPQTDVHLDSSKPLEVKVSHDPQVA